MSRSGSPASTMIIRLEKLVGIRSQLTATVEEYLERIVRKAAGCIPRFYPAHLQKDNAAFEMLSHRLRFRDQEAFSAWVEREGATPAAPHLIEPASMAWDSDEVLPLSSQAVACDSSIHWGAETWRHFGPSLILGGPHCGKTWFLLSEAQRLAQNQKTLLSRREIGLDDSELVLPIFVRLKDAIDDGLVDTRGGDAIRVLLKQTIPNVSTAMVDFAFERAAQQNAVFLLDGFSDVAFEQQYDLATWLQRFVDEHGIQRMFVTSRPSERIAMLLSRLQALQIEDLDDQQITQFSRNWFSPDEPARNPLEGQLRLNPHMRQWIQIPGILAMMCQVCADPDQEFPDRVTKLCHSCLTGLFQISYRSRGLETRDGEVLELVGKVALWLLEGASSTESYTEDQVLKAIRAAQFNLPDENRYHNERPEPVLEMLQDFGLLVPSGGDTTGTEYRFLTPILFDYFAAQELGAGGAQGVASAMQHLYDPSWRNVLRLLGGAIPDRQLAEKYIRDLAHANEDDLFCRPLKTAMHAAFEAGQDKGVGQHLLDVVVNHYLQLPDWFPESWKPRDGAWVNRTIPDVLLTWRGQIGELLLTKLAESTSFDTSAAAIDVLGELGETRVVLELIDWLQVLDARNRYVASEALVRIGGMATVDAVVACLDDPEHTVRHASLQTLSNFKPSADIRSRLTSSLILRLAQDDHAEVRAALATLMGSVEIRDHDVLKLLLNDGDSTVRVRAIETARSQHARELAPELRELASQADTPDAIVAAAACLGQFRDRGSHDLLLKLLEHRNPRVRAAAAGALRRISRGGTIRQVRTWLNVNGSPQGLRYAVEAMARIGGGEVVGELVPHLREVDQAAVPVVAEQLGRLADEAVPELVNCVREKPSDPLSYIDALVAIGSPAAASALTTLLESAASLEWPPAVSAHVATWLGQLHASDARPILEELLRSPDEALRGAAARSRAEIGDLQVGSAAATIVNMLDDPQAVCRRDAATALSRLDRHFFASALGIEALRQLRILLEDAEPDVRAAAAHTLGLLEDCDAVAPLMTLLAAAELAVVARARVALQRIADSTRRALPINLAPDSVREWHTNLSDAVRLVLDETPDDRVPTTRSGSQEQ